MADILTSDKRGLKLFSDGIVINKSLKKWANAKEKIAPTGTSYIMPQTFTTPDGTLSRSINTNSSVITNDSTITVFGNGMVEIENDGGASKADLTEIASMELRELNKYINDNGLTYILTKTGRYNNNWDDIPVIFEGTSNSKKKITFGDKVKLLFKKTEKPEMDVIEFFTKVKSSSKESFDGYVNRVEKYLKAIHNAKIIGQTALVEKLTREMIANKYESFLYSEGYYYVVTEEQVANFAKKSEKGIAIDYMKNFIRPIPQEVVDKISKADELEVFDNFVIMHYDPQGKARQDTAKEEDRKRRDPIVFGVIAGSTKLYYITDWVDEYCDLTLEKFVDTLGVKKNDLIEDEEIKGQKISEEKEKYAEEVKKKLEAKAQVKEGDATKKKTTRKKKETKKEE